MADYDIVVVGGGHNGLVVGAYLARSGLNVCVLEARGFPGGGVVTEEATLPGFKHDLAATVVSGVDLNPMFSRDELGLKSKYGVRFIPAEDISDAQLFPDGRSIRFHKDINNTCASIAQFSRKDADAFKKFIDWTDGLFRVLARPSILPPLPFPEHITSLMGSAQGNELLRAMLMSAVDLANEWFESDQLKIAVTRLAGTRLSPYDAGTGYLLMIMAPFAQTYGAKMVEGGSGRVTEALAQCIRDSGGTVRCSSPVRSIVVEGRKAVGVVLDDGEKVGAKKAVVSGINVKQLFGGMVDESGLPEGFTGRARRLLPSRLEYMLVHLALNEAPHYRHDSVLDRAFQIAMSTDKYEEFLVGLTHGYLGAPRTNGPTAVLHTAFDPSRAPAGKHTLWLVHQEPFYLKGGPSRWDEIKEEISEGILQTLRNNTTNMGKENILARKSYTPLDFARWNPAWTEGDPSHIGNFLYQYSWNRPLPGWSGYKTPVERLYMCGPSTHGGASLGAGGRAPANVIMKDLGIDFSKVI